MATNLTIIPYDTFYENRGEIFSFFEENKFQKIFPDIHFVQDRASISYKGTIRGFHGDPFTHKLVTCPIGEILLIAIDPKTEELHTIFLEENSKQSVLIPAGWINAHQCLSHTCMFLYKQSVYYSEYPADKQWTVKYNDPTIAAKWVLPPIRISDRDNHGMSLKELQNIL